MLRGGSWIHVRSSGTRPTATTVSSPGEAAVGLVDLDHQVGAAGQHERVGVVGERGEGVVQGPRGQHAHGRELYKTSSAPRPVIGR